MSFPTVEELPGSQIPVTQLPAGGAEQEVTWLFEPRLLSSPALQTAVTNSPLAGSVHVTELVSLPKVDGVPGTHMALT